MFKIGIVDDEPLVLAGLRAMIAELRPPVELAFEADNGSKALEAIAQTQPDLVLTDIRMPPMDGLELMRRSRLEGYTGQFVVISSYDEFKLAQEAMNAGACGYLIKLEMDAAVLSQVVEKARERQGAAMAPAAQYQAMSENLHRAETLRAWMQGQEASAAAPEQWMTLLVITAHPAQGQPNPQLRQCVQRIVEDVALRYFPGAMLVREGDEAILLCGADDQQVLQQSVREMCEKIRRLLEQYFAAVARVGVSGVLETTARIPQALAQVRAAMRGANAQEEWLSGARGDAVFDTLQKSICTAMQAGDLKRGSEVLRQAAERLGGLPLDQAQQVCLQLCCFVSGVSREGGAALSTLCRDESIAHCVYRLRSCAELQDWLERLAGELDAIRLLQEKDSGDVADRARQYIAQNLDKRFGLNDVAEALHISQGYLSAAFKKQVGMGFLDYVTSEKIRLATELLSSGQYHIYEVARRVGFENQYYFSKVFRKVMGCSPSEYLKRS